ncbi:DUF6221 family protein [Streptomyces goshikiensis]
MNNLVQFLHACYDEEAQGAAGASAGPWTSWRGKTLLHGLGQLEHGVALPGDGIGSRASIATASWMDAEHIARHNPARVLAEVDVRRRLIQEVLRYEAKIDGEWGCCHSREQIAAGLCEEINPDDIEALRLLALPYADQPGYREKWRPT